MDRAAEGGGDPLDGVYPRGPLPVLQPPDVGVGHLGLAGQLVLRHAAVEADSPQGGGETLDDRGVLDPGFLPLLRHDRSPWYFALAGEGPELTVLILENAVF